MSFRYEPDKPLIEDFTLEAAPGQTIAIVGQTGAGKTTVVNLLMRFYEIDAGTITLDGTDYRDLTRDQVRRCFGMVLQDTWLFAGTIRDNIGYGKQDATAEEIAAAARAAYADHFIRTLPDGYDTLLDEDASNLSAGQKQLLTIARAFLASPPILILDEATSNVDTRTEILIQEAMSRLRQGRTSFVIAHRLSTIRNADTIIVMDAGHIVEQGNHADLLRRRRRLTTPSTTASSPRTSPRQANGARHQTLRSVTVARDREPAQHHHWHLRDQGRVPGKDGDASPHHSRPRGFPTPGSPVDDSSVAAGCSTVCSGARAPRRHRPWPGPTDEVVGVCLSLLAGQLLRPAGFLGLAELVHHVDHPVDIRGQPERDRDEVLIPLRRGLDRAGKRHHAVAHRHGNVRGIGEREFVEDLLDIVDDVVVRAQEALSKSRRVTMPTSLPSESTTGSLLTWCVFISRAALGMVASGWMVMAGAVIIVPATRPVRRGWRSRQRRGDCAFSLACRAVLSSAASRSDSDTTPTTCRPIFSTGTPLILCWARE